MSNQPKVSIVIPVYNGSDYLAEAIDSALAQDYSNIEVIVVNDGSNDDGKTEKVALAYCDAIRYFSKANGGVASALNCAIKNMAGDYFSWLSHDDLYAPNKISRQMSTLITTGDDDVIVYSLAAAFCEDKDIVRLIDIPQGCADWFKYFLATNSSLHGCTLLIPRVAFQQCGTFNEDLKTTQDYDMWFRLADKYRFFCIREVLVKARQHAAQGTLTMGSIVRDECDALILSFIGQLNSTDIASYNPNESWTWLNLADISFRRGLVKSGRQALSKSGRVNFKAIYVRLRGETINLARLFLTKISQH